MSVHNDIIGLALENQEIVVPLVVGLFSALVHYRKTGSLPLGRLPLRALRKAWKEVSTNYFTIDRDRNVPALVVSETVEKLDSDLRTLHFESGDLYSFEYDGEVLNLRRPGGYHADPDTGRQIPSELHIRVFRLSDDKLLLLSHHEPSRFESWSAHMKGTYFSWVRGREQAVGVLDELGISYEEVQSEEEANLNVIS